LQSSLEIDLVKQLSKFDLAVQKARDNLAPKWIAHYCFSLCELFNSFYEAHRVIQETDLDIRRARLLLIVAVKNVLSRALGLLGIEPLERI
jgi:arginyl-tRNA synthetase